VDASAKSEHWRVFTAGYFSSCNKALASSISLLIYRQYVDVGAVLRNSYLNEGIVLVCSHVNMRADCERIVALVLQRAAGKFNYISRNNYFWNREEDEVDS
jgi:hypothetical protein